MISTVTTSTVTTVVTATFAASLALVLILSLLILLVQKEVASSSSNDKAKALSRVLNIAIIPLILSFVFIVLVKVAAALQYAHDPEKGEKHPPHAVTNIMRQVGWRNSLYLGITGTVVGCKEYLMAVKSLQDLHRFRKMPAVRANKSYFQLDFSLIY